MFLCLTLLFEPFEGGVHHFPLDIQVARRRAQLGVVSGRSYLRAKPRPMQHFQTLQETASWMPR
jgi:hypothetical protein